MAKRVTIKDIAKKLNLSIKAVSLGLNSGGRLSAETRRRILDTAHEMGYMPNAAARYLVTRRSDLIGVIVPYLNSSFFSRIVAGVEAAACDNGMLLLLGNAGASEARQLTQIERMLSRDIDGLILFPNQEMLPIAPALARAQVPTVQLMNHVPEFGDCALTVDNFQAGRDAAAYLISLGHRRIGMLAHDGAAEEIAERRRGFEAELASHADCELVVGQCAIDRGAGAEQTRILLAERPDLTALFAASDYAALGAAETVLKSGRRIPDDLSILGFDDVDTASEQLTYPLSTMAQPKEQLGTLAMEMLLRRISGAPVESIRLRAELKPRATTAVRR